RTCNVQTCNVQTCNMQTCNISFSNVSYAYPTRDLPALQNVSFDIHAGQLTALVGATGAGKSTLASLLMRFIEPSAGEIWVDGQPLAAIPPEEWRAQVAWAPQMPYLFNDTLAANLRLAKSEASDAELIRACQRADLHEFILSLPGGYETRIGERGARLSGGQAQRLALARAFLRQAQFLILDEPTSNLDPAQESRLSQAVRELMRGRTTLVIAHRLSTVYQADQIVVLDSGRLAESGKHADLLRRNGLYAKLLTAH
ncbi:MAG: ATP-binding cassette domain-containing protein, partial [Chloroflexi bacterium]|nr:ATP-binding cassette domain-containing protein [Chloroflexota bacterium]